MAADWFTELSGIEEVKLGCKEDECSDFAYFFPAVLRLPLACLLTYNSFFFPLLSQICFVVFLHFRNYTSIFHLKDSFASILEEKFVVEFLSLFFLNKASPYTHTLSTSQSI